MFNEKPNIFQDAIVMQSEILPKSEFGTLSLPKSEFGNFNFCADSNNASSCNIKDTRNTRKDCLNDMDNLGSENSVLRKLLRIEEAVRAFQEKAQQHDAEVNLLDMKTCHLKGKNKTVIDLYETDISDENASCLGYGVYPFIRTHLGNKSSQNIISWVDESKKTFVIHDPTQFAIMWGEEKKKEGMTKKKLYRSLTYLVDNKRLLKKTSSKKFMYTILSKDERKKARENRVDVVRCFPDSVSVSSPTSVCSLSSADGLNDQLDLSTNSFNSSTNSLSSPINKFIAPKLSENNNFTAPNYFKNNTKLQNSKTSVKKQETQNPIQKSVVTAENLQKLMEVLEQSKKTNIDFSNTDTYSTSTNTNGFGGNIYSFKEIYRNYSVGNFNDDSLSNLSTAPSSRQNSPINLPATFNSAQNSPINLPATSNSAPSDDIDNICQDLASIEPEFVKLLDSGSSTPMDSGLSTPMDSVFNILNYDFNTQNYESHVVDSMFKQYLGNL